MILPFPQYLKTVHHDGSKRYVKYSSKNGLQIGSEVLIRLRSGAGAPIRRVFVRTCPDGEQMFAEMVPGEDLSPCRWWQLKIQVDMPLVKYRFLIFTDHGVWWYNGSGTHSNIPTDAEDFRLLAGYQAPDWVRNSVFYQIFPDRFANGDLENDVQDGEFSRSGFQSRKRIWGEPPANGPAAMLEFYGGDLQGIISKLDHLQNLGVNALYLNPIFTAFSNHRYDVTDYDNVDPHLGGNDALIALRQETKKRGMKIILDIVPNHLGVMHPWFQSALANPNAPTSEYFTFKNHPEDYACWLGVRSLPKLNYRSQRLRDIMYAGPNAVFRTWLRAPYTVDGWRLDVANMLARQGSDQLGIEVGRGIRVAVKEENPQAYILGENFFDATDQLQGDMWDGVMNYSGFSKPLWYWLSRFHIRQHAQPSRVVSEAAWPTQALVDTWQTFRASIPWEIALQQFNLLGSHDTERILTRLGGNEKLAKLAAAVLLTYPGVPSVYYGDEIGQGDKKNSTSRDCMPWEVENWNLSILEYYRKLIKLRQTSSALIDGGFQVLTVEENSFAYLRDSDEEWIVVIANRGTAYRSSDRLDISMGGIPDDTEFTEISSDRKAIVVNGTLPVGAAPPGAEIWRAFRSL